MKRVWFGLLPLVRPLSGGVTARGACNWDESTWELDPDSENLLGPLPLPLPPSSPYPYPLRDIVVDDDDGDADELLLLLLLSNSFLSLNFVSEELLGS